MPNKAPKLCYPPQVVRQWQPAIKAAAGCCQTIMQRITDEAPPWTYDNAPRWLQSAVNWVWRWGALTLLGFSVGLGFSFTFL